MLGPYFPDHKANKHKLLLRRFSVTMYRHIDTGNISGKEGLGARGAIVKYTMRHKK